MTHWTRADLKAIHRYCIRHRDQIERSATCGCFYCLAMFPPAEILDWVDGPLDAGLDAGVTALCPRCGIDSVLPDNVPNAPLSPELLAAMQRFAF